MQAVNDLQSASEAACDAVRLRRDNLDLSRLKVWGVREWDGDHAIYIEGLPSDPSSGVIDFIKTFLAERGFDRFEILSVLCRGA